MRLLMLAVLAAAVCQAADNNSDFEYYRTHVEPIFTKHRATHGRCVTCHAGKGTGFMLQPLPAGRASWTEEQSRENYAVVRNLISPGQPMSSPLLLHPLAPEAGGDLFHSGGHQFASQQDPDFMAIATWVKETPKVEYKNLTVLTATDHLMDTMRFFNIALREDCTFCHVAGNFAADGNPRKAMARNMIHMTDTLAQTVGKNRVTCYTCHHGDAVPKALHPSFPHLVPEY